MIFGGAPNVDWTWAQVIQATEILKAYIGRESIINTFRVTIKIRSTGITMGFIVSQIDYRRLIFGPGIPEPDTANDLVKIESYEADHLNDNKCDQLIHACLNFLQNQINQHGRRSPVPDSSSWVWESAPVQLWLQAGTFGRRREEAYVPTWAELYFHVFGIMEFVRVREGWNASVSNLTKIPGQQIDGPVGARLQISETLLPRNEPGALTMGVVRKENVTFDATER